MVRLSFSCLCFIASPPFPSSTAHYCFAKNNSLSAQPLVSQGVYFNPAGTAEILLAAKPVNNPEAVTPLRNEGKSALQ